MIMRLLAGAFVASALLSAGGSTAWESHSWSDFIKGRFEGLSLTLDGRLTLAPTLESLAETGEAAVWAVATAPDGSLYLATGHRGRLLRLAADGKLTTVWAAPQPEIFALAFGKDGALYAGSSPDGRVWRIAGNKAEEWYNPQAKYIWALRAGPDGALLAATGDQGRIFRITGKAQGELYYETGQTHVTSLSFDSKGRLLAGSDPNGLLYRIESKNKGFVLYDSSLQEIRSILEAPDGALYVAALGPAAAQKQAQSASSAATGFQQTPTVTTTITVTADAAQTGLNLPATTPPATPPPTAAAQPPAAPIEIPGVEKTAIYKIAADNTVETLWSSKDENIFDITLRGEDVVFSTDTSGRVYQLSSDLKASLLVETREGEATRLLETPRGIVTATADLGKLFRLSPGRAASGSYESPVHDAGSVARWGRIDWRGQASGGRVTLKTRTGNSVRPDQTWSEWASADGPIQSPNARYIQYRVEISGGSGPGPSLDAVTLNYQPQNARPTVRSLQVTPQWGALLPRATASPATPTAAYSITVSDTGDSGPATSSGTPTQTVNRTGVQQLLLSWQADDPDNDRLVYSLYFRGEDEQMWKLIKGDMTENTHILEADVFADGMYRFRVVASDRQANSASSAREADMVSPPVMIDQTPPEVRISGLRRDGTSATAAVRAEDASSPVRRAEYSIDGGPWQPLDAADGVADSRQETFALNARGLSGKEHLIVVRVYDASGNAGLAKLVVR